MLVLLKAQPCSCDLRKLFNFYEPQLPNLWNEELDDFPSILRLKALEKPFSIWDAGTPLQYSCLKNLMDRGAWWAAVHGVAQSQTRLSDFTFTFHFHALEKEMATHSSVLAWRIPGTGEPGGLPSMGSHRVGHDWSDLAAAVAAFLKIPLKSANSGNSQTVQWLGPSTSTSEGPGLISGQRTRIP